MKKSKSKIITMTGFVEYARVFSENMDDNMQYHEKTKGQFNMNFYPETDEGFDAFFEAGAPAVVLGHNTIKQGNEALGSGTFLKLKRPNVHPANIAEFGGSPVVFDFREGPNTKRWSFTDDGELGNGTKVTVKVSIFGEGQRAAIRLEKIAVLELVEFDGASRSGIDKENF